MTILTDTIPIGGLAVNVYKLQESNPSLPIAVIFLLHGRFGSTKSEKIASLINALLDHGKAQRSGSVSKELVIVTFDHRNHGTRLVDQASNLAWGPPGDRDGFNPRHALDMYAMQTGSARDISFLIDFLPSYLYPGDDRRIVDWGVIGISLGGHSTWIVLKDEPRVSLGVPIIGCPDFLSLMEARASKYNVPFGPPNVPETLKILVRASDPCFTAFRENSAENPFIGKKILVLSGASDELVPWTHSKVFVDELEVGSTGCKEVIVQEGVGHTMSPEMLAKTAEFVWSWHSETFHDHIKSRV